MEHHKGDTRQVTGCGASGDDAARFLRELRQLRDGAGLGQAELAARAHYPYDSIRAAEVGPALPDLPVLSAYVRGCGGTAEEWEERWRSLTRSPSLPVPAARNAGNSAAATAGARISVASREADAPDPSIIIAALDRVAEEMAGNGTEAPGQAPGAAPAAPAAPAVQQPAVTVPERGVPGPSSAPAAAPAAVAEPAAWAEPAAPAELFAVAEPAAPDEPSAQAETTAWAAPSVPSAPSVPAAPFAAAEPPADRKPAGWDPIRVSSAWPAIPASSVNTAPSGGPGHAAATSSRMRTVVIAAVVLLCVLAVLLAIFA